MKNQTFRNVIAICAACIVAIGLTGSANAFSNDHVSICVDTYGVNGYPTWAGTNSSVKVEAKVGSTWYTFYQGAINEVEEWYNMPALATNICWESDEFTYYEVSEIRFTTYGGDALFFDRVILAGEERYPQGTPYWDEVKIWGVNNNSGYCLSTQTENEAARAYCHDGQFLNQRTFTK
ncbi:MAG: hypothetical protein JXR76_01575 [Deltaproteobacteria bacterium]|nr:hypothetical protein [Deltaproteobacteria bacterium]